MQPSSLRFAQALAERFAEILPPPLTVRVDGSRLGVHADGVCQGGFAAAVLVEADDDRTPTERVETAGRAVLSGIQDCVSEYLTLRGPSTPMDGWRCRARGWTRSGCTSGSAGARPRR